MRGSACHARADAAEVGGQRGGCVKAVPERRFHRRRQHRADRIRNIVQDKYARSRSRVYDLLSRGEACAGCDFRSNR